MDNMQKFVRKREIYKAVQFNGYEAPWVKLDKRIKFYISDTTNEPRLWVDHVGEVRPSQWVVENSNQELSVWTNHEMEMTFDKLTPSMAL
jgi:hypothetical protein